MFANLTLGPSGINPAPGTDLVALAVRHGFGGLDLHLDGIDTIEDAKRLGERVRSHGLHWGLFWLPCDFPAAGDSEYADGLTRLRTMVPLIQAAGCTRTYNHLMPGHDHLQADALLRHHIQRLRPVADLLGAYGISYGLEFIGPATLRNAFRYPYLHSLGGLLPLVDALGPAAGVVIDMFHWWTSGGTIEELRRLLPGRRIVNVHANDARAGRSRDQQLDGERELPLGGGLIDAAGIIGLLAAMNYDGPVIAEPFSPHRERLAALPADLAAAEVSACLTRLLSVADGR